MPFYHKLGNIPPKRHTQFRKPDGELYYEQLFGTVGFDGMYSNMYHIHRPTQVKEIKKQYSVAPSIAKLNNMQSYKLAGFDVQPEKDYLKSRKIVLTNADCHITLAAPQNKTQDYFYKNTDSDTAITCWCHVGLSTKSTLIPKIIDYLLLNQEDPFTHQNVTEIGSGNC